MNPLVFDGTHVVWKGHGRFKATSGGSKFQQAKFQDLVDKGPIPEGRYNFLAAVAAGSPFDKQGNLDTRQGIEQIAQEGTNHLIVRPGEEPQDDEDLVSHWGHNRVRLNVVRIKHIKARKRDGFYIHDSHKGRTHGCIEVAHAFFTQLRVFAATQKKLGKRPVLVLDVKYDSDDASTNGGTKF